MLVIMYGAMIRSQRQTAEGGKAAAVRGVTATGPDQGINYRPIHVIAALKEGKAQVDMRGDGHALIQVTVANLTREPMELVFQSGMVLISDNQLAEALIPRSQSIFLKPGEARRANLDVAPGSCRNEHRVRPYLVSLHRYEVLEPFWDYLAQHPEVGPEAVRTATLIIKENLPLSAFAKFSLSSGPKPDTVRDAGLEVETRHIMEALTVLQRAGYPAERLAILVDPQLQLEALLEPLTRPAAKRYFAMTDSDEWTFWENQLKTGNPSTRHYALYAIARFYPEVAIQMLPRWARFQELSLPMRRAAILALAEVPRPEAEGLLAQLEYELGASPSLGSTVTQAMTYWEKHVKLSEGVEGLAFQTGGSHGDAAKGVEMVVGAGEDATAIREPEQNSADLAAAAVAEASDLVAEATQDHQALWTRFRAVLALDGMETASQAGFHALSGPLLAHPVMGELSLARGGALLAALEAPKIAPERPSLLSRPLVRACLETPLPLLTSGSNLAYAFSTLTQLEFQRAIIAHYALPMAPAGGAEGKDLQAADERMPVAVASRSQTGE